MTDAEKYLRAAKTHIERVLATLEFPKTNEYNPGIAARSIEQASVALRMARVVLPRAEDIRTSLFHGTSMTVWKFPLETTEEQFITVPLINKPLCVQVQNGMPCIWMAVDSKWKCAKVRVRTFGTGHEDITPDMDYVGTYQLHGGDLVFHVFLTGVIS